MKILITGSKGMLGQELAKEFSENGCAVVAFSSSDLDITKEKDVEEKLKEINPDIVINAAAYNAVDKIEESEDEEEKASMINGRAVGYLAKVSDEIGATLVHYSTDYVFKGDKEGGYTEEDTPNTESKYAKSKLLGEKELLRRKYDNIDFKYYLIRTSRLFGRPAVSQGAKKSFVDTMLALSESRDSLDVIDEEVGSPTYVKDLAFHTRKMIADAVPHGIYHLTNSGSCTWFNWAEKIFEIAGVEIKLNPVSGDKFPRPAARPKYSALLNTKLSPVRTWEDALKDYLKSE